MRLRGINEAAAHFRACDPDTALTKTALRRLVRAGEIPSVRIGQKYLLDVDRIEDLFSQGTQPQMAPLPETGGIRRIEIER